MRPVALFLLSYAFALAPLCASPLPSAPVTVLFQFEQGHSAASLQAMERELTTLFKTTGYHFEFKNMNEVTPAESFDDLVVVKMKGSCSMADSIPLIYDERGALAFTHSSDGQVLPFSEVECDKVRNSVQRVLTGGEQARSEQLLGRALGRVLAHELYHIFAKTCHHGDEGVAKTALSGRQLVSGHLVFAASQLHELAQHRHPDSAQ